MTDVVGVEFLVVKDYKKQEEIVTKLNMLERASTSYIPPAVAGADDLLDDALNTNVGMANATIEDGAVVANDMIAGGVVTANTMIADGVLAANEHVEQVASNAQLFLAATAKTSNAAQARVARKIRLLDKAQTEMLEYYVAIGSLIDGNWLDLLKWVPTAARKRQFLQNLSL